MTDFLTELWQLAQAANEPHEGDHSGMYGPCDACYANRDLIVALSPERVLAMIECVRAADAMRKNITTVCIGKVAQVYDDERAKLEATWPKS